MASNDVVTCENCPGNEATDRHVICKEKLCPHGAPRYESICVCCKNVKRMQIEEKKKSYPSDLPPLAYCPPCLPLTFGDLDPVELKLKFKFVIFNELVSSENCTTRHACDLHVRCSSEHCLHGATRGGPICPCCKYKENEINEVALGDLSVAEMEICYIDTC